MAYYYGNTSSAPRAPPWQADSNMKSPSTSAYYAMQHPNDDSYYSYTPPGSIVASHTEQRHHAMYDHNSGQPMEVASITQEGQIPLSGKALEYLFDSLEEVSDPMEHVTDEAVF